MNLQRIALSHLIASAQPRPLLTAEVDKLAMSIKTVGLIQPITVTPCIVIHGIAETGFKIIAGHHRVAACRAIGWTEIDALVIDGESDLQSELIEIDENLCRVELTAAQRASATKRRKQIWEALHPYEIRVAQAAPLEIGYRTPPIRPEGFAAATADATGQSKANINRAIARADALGDEALGKVANTSLDSGVELDALAKLPPPIRSELIDRAAAGENVSARAPIKPTESTSKEARNLTLSIMRGIRSVLDDTNVLSIGELWDSFKKIRNNISQDELDDLAEINQKLMQLHMCINLIIEGDA